MKTIVKILGVALLVTAMGCAQKTVVANNDDDARTPAAADLAEDTAAEIKKIEYKTAEKGARAAVTVDLKKAGSGSFKTKACGHLYYGESSRNALNNEDAIYSIKLDCSFSGLSGTATHVFFPRENMSSQRRGALTNFMRTTAKKALAEKNTDPRSAIPYVCFRGTTTEKLCGSTKTAIAKEVEQFTMNKIKFKSKW